MQKATLFPKRLIPVQFGTGTDTIELPVQQSATPKVHDGGF